MQLSQITKTGILASGLLLSFWIGPVYAQATDDTTKPDNTSVNKRDRNPGEATADQQKTNAADRALTAKIRKDVIADKSLSTYAHNIKIITQDGKVTLKGPVRTADDKASLEAKAVAVAGADNVTDQLEIAPKQ